MSLKLSGNIVTGLFIIVYLCLEGYEADTLSRPKREARQCKDKYARLGTHSACKPRSNLVQYAGVNQSDVQLILDEHNKYRAYVNPPAANMMKMYWDPEVAELAQAWAETCSFTHDENWDRYIPGGLTIGQNIGKGYFKWTDCIKAWYDEKKDFQYGGKVPFEKIGHYTQLVWAISSKLGCGMANCGQYNFHVCNYAPAGNIGDHNKPYAAGKSACEDCSTCHNKLCDCGNKACANEGTLHPGNCSCTCKYSEFQIQPECKLDCGLVLEPWMCGTGSFNKAGCRQYSGSVPSACPLTCDICPYAGYNYTEQGIPVQGNGANGLTIFVIYSVICWLVPFIV